MSNALHIVSDNFAIAMLVVIALLLINLIILFILNSKIVSISQEVKTLNLESLGRRQTPINNFNNRDALHSHNKMSRIANHNEFPSSSLIEKAISLIQLETPAIQIQKELGIDKKYLDILIKQHKK